MWPSPWRRRGELRSLSPKMSAVRDNSFFNIEKFEQKPLQEVKAAILIFFLLPSGY